MIDPFVTFVICTESLDDPQLLLSVQSIRQQVDICWELKIEVPVLPDSVTIDTFTHCNPRVSINQRFASGKNRLNSTAVAFIPKGLELLPNACSELKKAFVNQSVDIVSAKVIHILAEGPELPGSTRIIPFIIATRMRSSSKFSPLSCEIDIPIGVIQNYNFAAVPVKRSKSPISVVDNQIRAEHLAHLEREILVLQTQLQSLAHKSQLFDLTTGQIQTCRNQIVELENQISAIKSSHTWRIGRFILYPMRILRK
jgi:hypothetical protein